MSRWCYRIFCAVVGMMVSVVVIDAQEPMQPIPKAQQHRERTDSVDSVMKSINESMDSVSLMSLPELTLDVPKDSAQVVDSIPVAWKPSPKKALWLALAIPGGGQIYNRKFWKLPIIYGGFIGCVYALKWNNQMYGDYSQAYIDIMDDDPNTKSYEDFVPIGYNVEANAERLKDLFKRKKDYYRRYRDLSIFCMIGVYALSVIDAYVDAEMSSFDISKDLSMKVRPSVISGRENLASRPSMMPNAYGLSCSLEFGGR
ncbi:MAG: DUF5683 domain-containing protein [Bacteroidales bacterium]|nr:DUF5683 domain-containing protein [Bacteroidales bacterium]